MRKEILVVPYNIHWPILFKVEALAIKNALAEEFIAVHHIGSTSVPGLAAKPKIDIIAVVRNPKKTIKPLEQIGFVYKGEWNIPMKYGFSKRGEREVNLHVYEESHPEIELNLMFRDYLCQNEKDREHSAQLKMDLLQKKLHLKK